jgi:sulfate transport system ATP-binding protein
MTLELEGITRRFGPGTAALNGVTMAVREGEFVALLGPSGSGKTTLLRILAGLDFPDAGRLSIGGRDMVSVPARLRRVGLVFQHYALFRHMTVFENIAFGLRVRPRSARPSEREIASRVTRLLELVQIPELARRRPEEISGGQRQRVALARALAIEPSLLLLDEPFGALDAQVRKEVRRWLRELHDRLGITSVLVTHDQEEAMELADRVAVLRAGRLAQFDTPARLVEEPADAFVAGFIGDANGLPAMVTGGFARLEGLPVKPVPAPGIPDGPAQAFVRPRELVATAPSDEAAAVATIRSVRPEPGGARLTLQPDGGPTLDAVADPGWTPCRGARCALAVVAARVFPAEA